MKNNTTLFRKLKAYSAMAGSLAAIAGTAQGQAFYTDVEPDVTVDQNGDNYGIDLNNDGTIDFNIQFVQATGSTQGIPYSYRGIFAKPYNGGSIAASSSSGRVYDLVLNQGQGIDAGLSWNNNSSQTMGSVKAYPSGGSIVLQYGNFVGVEDKFLGLRFKINNVKHYGWARFDVDDVLGQFTIKDYAYNTANDAGLFAGQGDPTSVQAVPMESSVKIFAYEGMVNAILINQKINNASLVITNMLGQQVKSLEVTHEFTRTDLSDLPAGIYVATLKNNGTAHSVKVGIRK